MIPFHEYSTSAGDTYMNCRVINPRDEVKSWPPAATAAAAASLRLRLPLPFAEALRPLLLQPSPPSSPSSSLHLPPS